MHSRLGRTLSLWCGLAVTGILLAATASAHGAPYKVTAGSAASGTTVAFDAVASNPVFRDITTATNFACSSSRLRGSLTVGTSQGFPVATVDGSSASFSGCLGPAGLQAGVTGVGTWTIVVTDSTNGVSTGTLANVRIHVTSGSCGFDLGSNSGSFSSSGTSTITPASVPVSYSNASANLVTGTGPSFGAWNVNPGSPTHRCGSVAQGDQFSLAATYHVSAGIAAYNPIAIN